MGERDWKGGKGSVLTPIPAALLRIVCATNISRRPSNPSRWPAAGRQRGGGGGGRSGRSCVYKPDRWSGAPTRTIKQKTTGCFLTEPHIALYFSIARFMREERTMKKRDTLTEMERGEQTPERLFPHLPYFLSMTTVT